MGRGEKYSELTTYLERSNADSLKLSFPEIENIIGMELPESAYRYQALWSNSESHAIAFGWLNAGYMTKNVDVSNETIEFVRTKNTDINCNIQQETQNKKSYNNLPVELALDNIRKHFEATFLDEHSRNKSWIHCHNAFCENRNITTDTTLDYLSLQLAFYLASWGMYRGSSFLLQKDYKVHIPIIKIIQDEKYNPLWGITAKELQNEDNLDLLDEISNRIRKIYAIEKSSIDGITNNATDTLVTKILLGTLGCVPAYDRFYIQAVKAYGISSGVYNRNSVKDVATYYILYENEFEALRSEMNKNGIEYPPMKLMDMCMWQLGLNEDL